MDGSKLASGRKLQFTLGLKGFLLLALLLSLELLFIGYLEAMIRGAEEDALRAEHSKDVLSVTHRLVRMSYEAGGSLRSFTKTRDSSYLDKFDKGSVDAQRAIKWLRENVAKNDVELVDSLDANLRRSYEILKDLRKQVETTEQKEMLSKLGVADKELTPLLQRSIPELLELRKHQEEIEKLSPKKQKAFRRRAQQFLHLGIIANVLLVIGLGVLFIRTITSRLAVIVNNTQLLGAGKPLLAPLAGTDEIAGLDHVFHQMAVDLDEASQTLRKSEARWRLILDSMPVGIIVVTKEGFIEAANPTTEHLFQFTSSELVGLSLGQLFCKTAKDSDLSDFVEKMHSKYVNKIGEVMAVRKDGSEFPVEFSLKEFHLHEGSRFLAIAMDISERYEIQKIRQQFVAMVSHDLRTPLTSLHLFLNMLTEDKIKSEDVVPRAQQAENSVRRLIALINDLLDLERLESGQLVVNKTNWQVADLLIKTLESLSDFAEEQDVELIFAPTSLEVVSDGDRLVQVLINLVSNSIKFSPPQGTVSISVKDDSGSIEFRIKDEGRGIPAHMHESIFERFKQVKDSDATEKGGSGLGLAICKAVVEQHGGTIGVDSVEGHGSEFWFRIPKEH